MFSGLLKLTCLKLSHNDIQNIDPGAFKDLKELRRLELEYNKLTCLTQQMLAGPHIIIQLDLTANCINYIGHETFRSLYVILYRGKLKLN